MPSLFTRISVVCLLICVEKSCQSTLPPSSSSIHHLATHNDVSETPQLHNLFHRRFTWNTPSRRKHRRANHSKGRSLCGTRLTLRRPTPETVARWFAALGREFNHDSVGITNPCLHIALPSFDNDKQTTPGDLLMSHVASNDHHLFTADTSEAQLNAPSVVGDGDNVEDSWWPNTCQSKQQLGQSATWRVARYRRRIGRGQDCYERVRNAALDWEFAFGQKQKEQQHHPQGDRISEQAEAMGILAIHPPPKRHSRAHETSSSWASPTSRRDTSSYGYHQGGAAAVTATDGDLYAPLTRDAARHVLQLWSGPGGRRLVTYTGTSGNMFRIRCLPRLYAVNPVMVVYDLIDQRGPGTTYTSTAYATLKGHWLSGEERVTVALRDGVHGDVDVEILSYSRPAPTFAGKLVWPFIGQRQRDFFERQLEALEHVARRSGGGGGGGSGRPEELGPPISYFQPNQSQVSPVLNVIR